VDTDSIENKGLWKQHVLYSKHILQAVCILNMSTARDSKRKILTSERKYYKKDYPNTKVSKGNKHKALHKSAVRNKSTAGSDI